MPITMAASPFHCVLHQSRAWRETPVPSASGLLGTRLGKRRTPPLYVASGNGASWAAASADESCGQRAPHQLADRHIRVGIAPCSPLNETICQRSVARRERGVHDQQRLEAVGHLHWEDETEQTTSILTYKGHATEIKGADNSDLRRDGRARTKNSKQSKLTIKTPKSICAKRPRLLHRF